MDSTVSFSLDCTCTRHAAETPAERKKLKGRRATPNGGGIIVASLCEVRNARLDAVESLYNMLDEKSAR